MISRSIILVLGGFLMLAVEMLIGRIAATPECNKDELYFQGRCYHFKNDAGMSFEAARVYCLKRDSHMVIIDNADQNRFLLTQDNTRFGRWIGMMRLDEGGGSRFHWVPDDSTPVFTNFNDAKMDLTDQKCVYMDTDGRWADNTCNQPYNVMCQRNPLHGSIQALQRSVNNTFGAIQHHLTMIEYMFSQMNKSNPTNASLAQLVAQLKAVNQPTPIGPNATRSDIQLAQSMLKKLLDQTKALSGQISTTYKNQTLPSMLQTADIRTRLTVLLNLYQTFTTQLDNLTRQHTADVPTAQTAAAMLTDVHATLVGLLDRNRQATMSDLTTIHQQFKDAANAMQKHFNATIAKLQASEAQMQRTIVNSINSPSSAAKAAALSATNNNDNRARYSAIIHDRVPVALMLIMLLLQIFLVSILVLLGIYIRRRLQMDRSFQYNVTTAASRFSNGHSSMGRNAMPMQQTGSSTATHQPQYEEIGALRNNRDVPFGGLSAAKDNNDDGNSSVTSARTNTIYMSAVDAAVAELENQEPVMPTGSNGSVARDSGVESSAGSVLSRNNSLYDPHNDKKQLVRLDPPPGHLKGGNLRK